MVFKGTFLKELKVGMRIEGLDWDDLKNACGCPSAFNGFYNIIAGYTGGSPIPCQKFDIQSTKYPIQ